MYAPVTGATGFDDERLIVKHQRIAKLKGHGTKNNSNQPGNIYYPYETNIRQ